MFNKIFRFIPQSLWISLLSKTIYYGVKALERHAAKGEKSHKALEKIKDVALIGIKIWAEHKDTDTTDEFLEETKRKLAIKNSIFKRRYDYYDYEKNKDDFLG